MLGRPNWVVPVFTNSFAGAWLKTSVATDRMMATSSTTFAKWGRHSETHAPDSPCWANFRVVPRSLGGSFVKVSMNANRLPLMNDSGIGLLWYSWSLGLWSKSSSWLGPPAMNR